MMSMKKLMNKLMLSCRKASELIEKKTAFRLTRIETIQLFMHTRMCDACQLYYKQSKFIDDAVLRQHKGGNRNLKKKKKKRIIDRLEQQ